MKQTDKALIDGRRRVWDALHRPAQPSDVMLGAARAALARMGSDARTEEQIIDDGAAFLTDTRLGGS